MKARKNPVLSLLLPIFGVFSFASCADNIIPPLSGEMPSLDTLPFNKEAVAKTEVTELKNSQYRIKIYSERGGIICMGVAKNKKWIGGRYISFANQEILTHFDEGVIISEVRFNADKEVSGIIIYHNGRPSLGKFYLQDGSLEEMRYDADGKVIDAASRP